MPDLDTSFTLLGLIVVTSPLVLMAVLGISSLLDQKLSEEATGKWSQVTIGIGFFATALIFVLMLVHGLRHVVIDVGNWVAIENHSTTPASDSAHYHFVIKFVF